MKVEYVNRMGDDLTVVNAARVSFDKTKYEMDDKDVRLIKYLYNHHHWTPFSHPQITLRETVPIFVARQRFKHMVGFTYNEVSRRYVDYKPEFFVPEGWRQAAENKKQGSLDTYIPLNDLFNGKYLNFLTIAEELYEDMLANGVAPEQARMVLPQSMYTSYYVTGSLYAFMNAYRQRSDRSHAQLEIVRLAEMWDEVISPLFPVSWGHVKLNESVSG